MKLRIMTTAFLIAGLLVCRASAQTFNLGLEAGANFANFIGDDVSKTKLTDSRLGFAGGGFLGLNFGNNFSIRPEILYEQKGAKIAGESTTSELDYLEVPILVKLSLGTPVVNPAILLGPAFSENVLSNNLSGVNSFDTGLIGGVELDFDKLIISGRYELGLQNVENKANLQNGTLTFLVGYSFI